MFVDGKVLTADPRDRLVPGPRGVRVYRREKCFRGYTMFSTAFGDTEYLIDMNGMVVHTWPVHHSQYAEILPNGNLMAGNYGHWIEEIDPRGERVWIWEGGYRHDFHVVDDETIVFMRLNRDEPVMPGLYPDGCEPEAMESDVVVCMNRRTKEVLWEFPYRDHLKRLCELAGLPMPIPFARRVGQGEIVMEGPADWGMCNTIEVLPDTPAGRKDERFRAGNLLFSFRRLDTIAVADVEKNEIVWAWGPGALDGQHQPTMTPAGTILIFDNGTARNYSAVVEIDPVTCEEVWRYEDRSNFCSLYRSGVQRLPNGNTLVAECDAGRLFELTPEKEIVWEYLNPFFAQAPGSQGLHVFRATRYSEEQVAPVLAARENDPISTAVADLDRAPLRTWGATLRHYREGLGG